MTSSCTDHPITAGLADFKINDERYSYLQTNPDICVLCEHDFEGVRHSRGVVAGDGDLPRCL